MPAYIFRLPANTAGYPVKVYADTDTARTTVLASGTLTSDATFQTTLPVGNYVAVARAAIRDTTYTAGEELVSPSSSEDLSLDALKATFGSRTSALHPTVSQMKPAPYRIITTFQAGHGYTAGGAGTVTLNDTSVTVFGTQGVTVVTDSASLSGTLVSKAGQAPLDLSAQEFAILAWVDDVTKLDTLAVQFGDTAFTNYSTVNALVGSAPGTTTTGLQGRSGEWTWLHFTWAEVGSNVGTLNRAAVTDIRLRIAGRGAGSVTVKVAAIAYFPKQTAFPVGVATFCLDDGYTAHKTIAAPALGKYGYPATLFPICDGVGTGGRMTVAEMQQLCRINRFEVAGHAYSLANHNLGYANMTPEDVETDIAATKQWIIDNGLPLADVFAWPSGSDSLVAENIVRKYYSAARHVIDRPRPTLPPGVPYRVTTLFLGTTVTLAKARTEVDNAVANGSWIILSFHDLTTGTPTGGQWSASDFQALVDYVASKGMPVQTFGQVIRALS